MLTPEATITMVTALAATIAQGRENDEIELLAAVFTQLGDSLATIAVVRDKNKAEKKGENSAGKNPA